MSKTKFDLDFILNSPPLPLPQLSYQNKDVNKQNCFQSFQITVEKKNLPPIQSLGNNINCFQDFDSKMQPKFNSSQKKVICDICQRLYSSRGFFNRHKLKGHAKKE